MTTMKKTILLIVAFIGGYSISQCYSQDTVKHAINAGWGNLDYSTPSDPAFKILGTDPDNILRPTSAKTIAVNVGNYFLNGGSVIPKSLSVEISPLLLNSKTNIADYQKNLFWYRMRFSFGSAQNTGGATKVAEGIKFTIIDKSDLRNDNSSLVELATIAKANAKYLENEIEKYAKDNQLKLLDVENSYHDDKVFAKKINALTNLARGDFQNTYKNNHWNAAIWDVGIATLQTSKDSLIKNLQFSKIGLWTTGGIPMFGTKGQLLIGGKIEAQDSVKWQTNFSLGSRLYYGSNDTKAYIQGEYKYQSNAGGADFGLGCVFNISNGLWGQAAINIVIDAAGKVSYMPSFNIGFGTGDKKK
jgi:hypothetical protein